ncbi:MAG TPA: SDR family NAD(P)-dependent oxidoreductase [Candidatus Eisenbergiella merdipullorum]|uniref:SDR family NAD(P)-dependent oxidoreductase n=1 Tax=Candidatus Eisenbergiella merdipullorum TaxID=2838553 RepID=A0A9D2I810_9FIRM|nr:SDR family NAD(P)-dependent oxidoreductase [Candidatus Eisenbergiella merdipullorum]
MGKKALVTGASRGIGRAIAEELASQGYDLYLTCLHSMASLTGYAEELGKKYGSFCQAFQGDMGNPEDVERLFSSIRSLDALVNNAGISYIGLLQDMTPEEWNRVLSTNLTSCFLTCRQAIPLMLHAGGGRILNISSVWGAVGASTEAAYSASKGAVNSLTKALAKELAPSNIQVNALACGVIDTDMNRCFTPEEMQALMEEIPAGRLGTPKEAAALAGQILNAPDYMTGQIITLDGGWI